MKNRFLLPVLGLLFTLAFPIFSGAEPSDPFAKWEKEISELEHVDQVQGVTKNAILFTGSSTIKRWKTLAQDLPGRVVLNRGFGGSQICDATHFAERIIFPHAPQMIVLRAGGNDLHAGKSPAQVFEDFKAFIAIIQTKLPTTEVVYLAACPSIARITETQAGEQLNELIRDYAKSASHVKYLDASKISLGADGLPQEDLFVEDKLHLNAEGYKRLAEKVRAFLDKELPLQ